MPLKGVIPAKGYLIFERNDDGVISDAVAHQFLNGEIGKKGYLSLINEKGRGVDHFYFPYSSGWQKKDFVKDDNHYSVERISPYVSSDSLNWKINNGEIINGLDRNENPIFGTPGKQNSNYQIYTPITTDFAYLEEVVLPASLSPYLIQSQLSSGGTYIFEDTTLIIEPGAVLKFSSSSGLQVKGTLKAIGTPEQKIVFTSLNDDDWSGDTNNDGSATSPYPGSWLGIYFTKTSRGSELENVIVKYSGKIDPTGSFGAGIKVEKSSISLKNSTIEKNANYGLRLTGSDSTIEAVEIFDHTEPLTTISWPKGINVNGGSPVIKNSHFRNNYQGLTIGRWYDPEQKINVPASAVIESNYFEGNKNAAIISSSVLDAVFPNNQMTNNNFNGIVLMGDVSENTVWPSFGLPYIIKDSIRINPGKVLTIEPGVIIKFGYLSVGFGLSVDGEMKALGTPEQKIVFTSLNDDEYGGDTNNNANNTSPDPGNWQGIYFGKESQNSELENVIVRYAGAKPTPYELGAGIKVYQGLISLKNSIIEKNHTYGLRFVNSFSTIDAIQVSENKTTDESIYAGIRGGMGIKIEGINPRIANSVITENYYGIYQSSWRNPDTGENFPYTPILQDENYINNICSGNNVNFYPPVVGP